MFDTSQTDTSGFFPYGLSAENSFVSMIADRSSTTNNNNDVGYDPNRVTSASSNAPPPKYEEINIFPIANLSKSSHKSKNSMKEEPLPPFPGTPQPQTPITKVE